MSYLFGAMREAYSTKCSKGGYGDSRLRNVRLTLGESHLPPSVARKNIVYQARVMYELRYEIDNFERA